MKRPNKGAAVLDPVQRSADHGRARHRHCNILRICPGASLKGLPHRKFERLMSSVRRTLEGLLENPQPPENVMARSQTRAALATARTQCWETGRYYTTINGEPHLCIQYMCDDHSSYEACYPV